MLSNFLYYTHCSCWDRATDDGYVAVSPEDAAPLASLLTNALGTLEPSSRAAFSALLTLLHASNVVTTSHTSERNEAVQAAAVALGQLSQQGPSDSVFNASSISQDQVCPKCPYCHGHKNVSYRSKTSGFLEPRSIRRHWLICRISSQILTLLLFFWTITSRQLQSTGYGLLFIDQALTVSIEPSSLDHTIRLLISMHLSLYFVHVHCSFCLTPMTL